VSADPPRNFSLPAEDRIRAIAIGVPAWSARKRRIEDTEAGLVDALVALFDANLAAGAATDDARARMRSRAASIDLAKLRALVAAHNRWFPIEANLPIDPASSRYLVHGRPWTPEPEPAHDRLVARAEAAIAARACSAEE
jgi:hypothetical protein